MFVPAALIGLDALRRSSDWKRWGDIAVNEPPYLAPEFFAISQPLATGDQMLVAEAWAPSRILGALPLALTGDILRGLRTDHTPKFDYCGTPEGLDAIWDCLREDARWNELRLDRVPASSALATRLPELARRDNCPVTVRPDTRHLYLPLPGFMAAMNPKFRIHLNQCARKVDDLELERILVPTRADLDEAAAIEAMAWKGAARATSAADPRVVHLYQALGRLFGRRGRASLYFLRSGGLRIATLFALEDRHTLFALKIGADPRYGSLSPGHLIVMKVAADAEQRGLRELDFVGHEGDWKRKWTDQAREHVAITVYRRSVRGLSRYTLREVVKPRLPATVREMPYSPLLRRCQQEDVLGCHTIVEEIRGRVDQSLVIKSGLRRALTPVPLPAEPRGTPSRFPVGSWVRVIDTDRLAATLDPGRSLRGLAVIPVQWETCGHVYKVASHVRRIRDDHGRFRPVDGTVLLEGVDCAGNNQAPSGCGRHCPLMFRDEWLEAAPAPRAESTEAIPGRHARILSREEIYASLDAFGRRDGLTFMPQMAAYAGRRLPIARELTMVFEYDRWTKTRTPVYILGGLQCDGSITGARGPCDRACALRWHPAWLMIEPEVAG